MDENIHALMESGHQTRFSLNTWLVSLLNRVLSPIVLPKLSPGPVYLHSLQHIIRDLLHDTPSRKARCFQHHSDGVKELLHFY